MRKAIHAQEDREAALKKAEDVAVKLEKMKLKKAASLVRESVHETLGYMSFPREHWTRLRTNNPLERLMKEIKRRTKVVGAFPDGNSALMPAAARVRHVAGTRWGTRKYPDMDRLYELERQRALEREEEVLSVAVSPREGWPPLRSLRSLRARQPPIPWRPPDQKCATCRTSMSKPLSSGRKPNAGVPNIYPASPEGAPQG